jgi:hypothetical protein
MILYAEIAPKLEKTHRWINAKRLTDGKLVKFGPL